MNDHYCTDHRDDYEVCQECGHDCTEDLVLAHEKRVDEGLELPDIEDEDECSHDDIDGGYCIDCEKPIQDFMDCDYFKDRQDD